MNNNFYNVVYVGAGPANIFSILSHPIPNSLLIEKGKALGNRTRKDVLFGFGGSGTFSDSKLVCSGRISQLRPDIDFDKYADEILRLYNRFYFGTPFTWLIPDKYEVPSKLLYLIKSRVCHVGSDNGEKIFKNIQDYIQKYLCPIHFEETVISIKEIITNNIHEGYSITTDKHTYLTKQVVLGTGPRDTLLTQLIQEFNLPFKYSNIQIGVRVEVPNNQFKDLVDKFYDFKLAMKTLHGYFRTFCVNSGVAHVVVEKGEHYHSANGHAFAQGTNTGITNFALLGQLNIPYTLEEQIKLAKNINDSEGRLLCQNIEDFIRNVPSTKLDGPTTVNENDYYLGNFWKQVPLDISYDLWSFVTELKRNFTFTGHMFAPEVNLVQPKVELSKTQEIYPGLYCVGDILLCRSIVDAGISGMLVGEELEKEILL